MAKLSRKLTIKTICGDVKKLVQSGIASKKPVAIARIVGSVMKVDEKANRFDDTKTDYALIGQFRGINLLDETIQIDSNRCYLPAFVAEQVAAQVMESEGEPVEFGVDIIVAENEESPVGYSFDAQALIEAAPSPTLDRLLQLATGKEVPKLAAPKKEGKKKPAKK